MDDCLKCKNHKKIPIAGSSNGMRNVICRYIMKLSEDVPLDMEVGRYGEDIERHIKPPKGCPINCKTMER